MKYIYRFLGLAIIVSAFALIAMCCGCTTGAKGGIPITFGFTFGDKAKATYSAKGGIEVVVIIPEK